MNFVALDPRQVLQRLERAETLLDADSTTKAKFYALRKLVKGINPALDKKLSTISRTLKQIDLYKHGKVVELTVHHLPEDTKERKKRKKYLLLLLKQWKGLKSEVKRVKKELQKSSQQSSASKVRSGGKLLATAKGPLGLVTVMAAVIAGGVIYLNTQSVTITIKNVNCETIEPIGMNFNLPGIKLPNEPIPAGGQTTLMLPPFLVQVDASNPNKINLSALRMNLNFDRSRVGGDILFNGQSLLNRVTDIKLGSQKSHIITVTCQ